MGTIDTEIAIPEKFDLSLPVTAEIRQQINPNGVVAVAESYVIDSNEMAVMANDELKNVKGRWKTLDDMRKKFVEPARQMIANAQEMFNPALDQYAKAEQVLKGKLSDWQTKEAARIAEENRKREEEARIARQKAEQEAAAARARAEQEAQAARQRAAEAERQRQEAEAAGNAAAAKRAAAAAAKAAEQAAAAIENGQAQANAAVMQAAAAETAPVAVKTEIKGFSMRDNWTAQLKAGADENAAKTMICQAIASGRTELIALLALDMKAAGQMAKALKGAMNVPGLEAVNKPVAASRG